MSAADRPRRASVSSGTKYEALAGYSRAVRIGDRVLVAGTTASGSDGPVAVGDAAGQARFVLDRIERALTELGATMRDVVRTRTFVRRIEDWEAVARVHGERFAAVRPVSTLVQAALVHPDLLVEIEVEAVIGAGDAL
jgi:enamine deaminase RidA (YjgF/YER057c/UK114 family)